MHPDTHSLRVFVERWLGKAQNAGDQPFPEFDRFIYAYIAFNSLYNAAVYVKEGHGPLISKHRWSRGGIQKPRFSRYQAESIRASELVVEVCGSAIHDVLSEMTAQVNSICECFASGQLYLHEMSDGTPDIATDKLLVDGVRGGNAVKLLKLIYLVRCNLFHGGKALSSVQDKLLSNSAEIVLRVCLLLLKRIEASITTRPNISLDTYVP
jgi:hypothetical protein